MDFANKYRPVFNRRLSGISANFGGRCRLKCATDTESRKQGGLKEINP